MSVDPQRNKRSAGILLHPTSLPGPFGIGDLGPAAHAFLGSLQRAGQSWWQVLPLGPTGYGDSPYQCFSAFAGNPALVSPELLQQDGLLPAGEHSAGRFPADRIDFGPVLETKLQLLHRAFESFQSGASPTLRSKLDAFATLHHDWLDDYALFMALKAAHGGASWFDWDPELARREPAALARARTTLRDAIDAQRFFQLVFFRQWSALRTRARELGIHILGDVPIFVAADSADVWARPELFQLDETRKPRVVAGVPPDYFSATGQLWGNPLYDWEAMRQDGYAWWIARLRGTYELVDAARIDHFRGFESYWEVPAGMPTAEIGRWVPGPGRDFFAAMRAALSSLPIVAEDLGLITPAVDALRDRFGLAGMRVLQFAFGGTPQDRFLPHNYEPNTVVYTGTHDNDTTRGWFASLGASERAFALRYLGSSGDDISWDLLRLAWSSVAERTFAPLQDILDLGSEARMNLPGQAAGNWSWRFTSDQLDVAKLDRLGILTETYGRWPVIPNAITLA